jgi:rubrerythrin
MKDMTRANIAAAFAGESQAHMKYSVYADKAEREGYAQVAKLFRAIAYAEKVHATNHLRVLDGVHSTAENLTAAAGGENYEVHEMYPAFNVVAELQDEKAAVKSIHYALEAEIIHEDLYTQAKAFVDEGKDLGACTIYVCPVCGHTAIGAAPAKCPVCGLVQEKYQSF